MRKSITPLNVFTHLACIVCLVIILTIQYVIIQPNRGSAMGISFSIYLIPLAVLMILILFFFDRKHSHHFSRIVGIVTQCVFLPYFIYKVIFYYRVDNDIQFYKDNFEDHFPPHSEDLWFAFILIILISFYSLRKIKV